MSGDRYFTYKTLSNEHILEKVRGVIHVGANYGQEREVYARHNLRVLWFEPIEDICQELMKNVGSLYQQMAWCFAISNEDNGLVKFHVTDNEGQSSSLLELEKHTELWPNVHEDKYVFVRTVSLDSFFAHYGFPKELFDFLVLDVQGCELKALIGATETLPYMKFVQVEATDCELYKGCAKLSEIDAFMQEHGFKEIERTEFSPRPDIGKCYEVLYERI